MSLFRILLACLGLLLCSEPLWGGATGQTVSLNRSMRKQQRITQDAQALPRMSREQIVARYGLSGDLTLFDARLQALQKLAAQAKRRRDQAVSEAALLFEADRLPRPRLIVEALFWNQPAYWTPLENALGKTETRKIRKALSNHPVTHELSPYGRAYRAFQNLLSALKTLGAENATLESYVDRLAKISSEIDARKGEQDPQSHRFKSFMGSRYAKSAIVLADGLERFGQSDAIDWELFAKQWLSEGQPVEQQLSDGIHQRVELLLDQGTRIAKQLAHPYREPTRSPFQAQFQTVGQYTNQVRKKLRRFESLRRRLDMEPSEKFHNFV